MGLCIFRRRKRGFQDLVRSCSLTSRFLPKGRNNHSVTKSPPVLPNCRGAPSAEIRRRRAGSDHLASHLQECRSGIEGCLRPGLLEGSLFCGCQNPLRMERALRGGGRPLNKDPTAMCFTRSEYSLLCFFLRILLEIRQRLSLLQQRRGSKA